MPGRWTATRGADLPAATPDGGLAPKSPRYVSNAAVVDRLLGSWPGGCSTASQSAGTCRRRNACASSASRAAAEFVSSAHPRSQLRTCTRTYMQVANELVRTNAEFSTWLRWCLRSLLSPSDLMRPAGHIAWQICWTGTSNEMQCKVGEKLAVVWIIQLLLLQQYVGSINDSESTSKKSKKKYLSERFSFTRQN